MSLPAILGLATLGFFTLRAIGGGSSEPENLDKKFTALPVPKDSAAAIWKDKLYMAGLRSISSTGVAVPDVAVIARPLKNGGPMEVTEILDVRHGYTGPKPKKGDLFTAIPDALVEIPDSGGVTV